MKTERRHELATNVLADWLGEKIEALKPYSAAASVTALLVVVLIFAGIVLYQRRQTSTAQVWSDYFSAIENQSPDEACDQTWAANSGDPRISATNCSGFKPLASAATSELIAAASA